MVAAAEAAIASSSSEAEQATKLNKAQKVGLVCAVLTGVARELQQPVTFELLGKRVKKLVREYEKKLRQLKLQLKSDMNHAKKVKGGDAAVAAKQAACKELHAAACEELRSRPTGCLAVSSLPEPAAAQGAAPGSGSTSRALVPTMTRSDSEAAATLLHASGRAWSCSNCAMLQEGALEARRAADAAADAKRLAEEAQARMWAAKEAARRTAEEQLSALEAEHAAALEAAQEKHKVALLKERDLRKAAQKEAATSRSQVVLEEARRAQVCRGTWETVQARESASASLEKAQAELRRVLERETAGHERQMQREQELQGRLQALEDEKQRLLQEHKLDRRALRDAHRTALKEAQAAAQQQKQQLVLEHGELAAAAALELRQAQQETLAAQTRLGCIEAKVTEVEHALQGEKVRRGRAEAALGRHVGAGAAGGDGAQRPEEQRLVSIGAAQGAAAHAQQVQLRGARGALARAAGGGGAPSARTSHGRSALESLPVRSGSAHGSAGDYGRTLLRELECRNLTLEEHVAKRDSLITELREKLSGAEEAAFRQRSAQKEANREGVREAAAAAATATAGMRAPRTFSMREIRNSRTGQSPLEPYSMEVLRRLMEEANLSFGGVNKCIALVWLLICGDTAMPADLLMSRKTMANAFLRLDQMDARTNAAKRRREDAPWAVAADGGNKGHAVNVIAISTWDFEQGAPRVEPLNVKSLNGDQSAKNSAATVTAALASSGLNPARCTQAMTDGCEAAILEGATILEEQHKLAMQRTKRGREGNSSEDGDDAAAAAPPPRKVSRGETCCIHGKALEERDFLDAAFPLAVDGLRLLWEIIKGDDKTGAGRVDQYREVWKKAGLDVELFDRTLAVIPEFTMAKWGCMREGCQRLLLISQRGVNNGPSKMQKFLAKCVELFNGSTDESKEQRVLHSHRHHIHLLYGIFSEDSMHAAIFAIADMWNKSYDEFFEFAKSPSKYGGFAQPHLRHMMADQVAKDMVYYRKARAKPVC